MSWEWSNKFTKYVDLNEGEAIELDLKSFLRCDDREKDCYKCPSFNYCVHRFNDILNFLQNAPL